jgi:D-alanyl-D-alanine carboxypeptidase
MKNVFVRFLFLLASGSVFAQPVLPPPPANVSNALANIFTNFRVNETIAPGLMVRIYNPNNWEWAFSDGIRNVELGTPATPDLVFRAASISKMVCASAVLKLASQGVLSLDDNIGAWLPNAYVAQIENNTEISIRDLLRHTSSLDEPQSGTSLANDFLANPDINYRDTLLQLIANQSGLPAGVGSFSYSNANFNLLAEIVKLASGISYQDYIVQEIIQPLNLTETYLDTLPVSTGFNGYIPCGLLIDCMLDPSTLLDYSQANVGWGYGAADISSTTKDLISYYYALQNGQIIPQNWVDSLTANSVDAANSFQNKRYGYGTMLFQKNDITYAIGHTGTAASHANVLCQLKPSNIYVCFSFNIIRMNREKLLEAVDGYLQGISTMLEQQNDMPVTVYPNPTRQYCTLSLSNSEAFEVSVLNTKGQVVFQKEIQGLSTLLDLGALGNGLYFIQVTNPEQYSKAQKLVIQR